MAHIYQLGIRCPGEESTVVTGKMPFEAPGDRPLIPSQLILLTQVHVGEPVQEGTMYIVSEVREGRRGALPIAYVEPINMLRRS